MPSLIEGIRGSGPIILLLAYVFGDNVVSLLLFPTPSMLVHGVLILLPPDRISFLLVLICGSAYIIFQPAWGNGKQRLIFSTWASRVERNEAARIVV